MQGITAHRTLLLLLFSLIGSYLLAQDDFYIYGTIKEESSNQKIESVQVQVFQDGKLYDTFTTSGNSKYEFEVPLGFKYQFKFGKSAFVNKIIEINTKNIPEEDQEGGFKLNMDMTLFEYVEGFDESILEDPLGKASYDPSLNDITFDLNHTAQMKNKIEAERERLENAGAEEAEKRKRYEALLVSGSDNMTKENYEGAIGSYESALDLYPDENIPQAKLQEAKDLLALQNKDKQLDADYEAFMADGNDLMKNENYEKAKSAFQQASGLKPDQREPKDKIREIDELMAQAERQAQFDEFMAAGDTDMGTEDYQSAVDNFRSARDIIPTDKDVKRKLSEAQEKLNAQLADADAEEANEKRYNDLLAKADASFKSEDYKLSISQYNAALEVKPSEDYPPAQIEEANKRIDELAAAEAESAANADQEATDAEYQAFIDKANSAFTSEDLQLARTNYQSAVKIKPLEKYPKQRIKRIDELLAEKEANLLSENKAEELSAQKEKDLLAQRERDKAKKDAEQEKERARLQKELEEKENLADAERKRKVDADQRRNLTNNIDTNAEKQAEEFYQQMKNEEDKVRYDSAQRQKDELQNWKNEKSSTANELAKDENSNIASSKTNIQKLYFEGENLQRDKRDSFDSGEKRSKTEDEIRLKANDRTKDQNLQIEQFKKDRAKEQTSANDKTVLANAEKTSNSIREVKKAQNGYRDTGEVLRKDNSYKIDRVKEDVKELYNDGEAELKKSEKNIEKVKEDRAKFIKENTELNEEKLAMNYEKVSNSKVNAKELVVNTNNQKEGNKEEVEYQKEKRAEMLTSNDEKTALKNKINREEAFNLKKGEPKNYDDYNLQPGKEKLAEGVTERSYEINEGRKLVIERTVKIGNKVDTYLKVIDKNATYYFKNNKSITKSSWNRETLYAED